MIILTCKESQSDSNVMLEHSLLRRVLVKIFITNRNSQGFPSDLEKIH